MGQVKCNATLIEESATDSKIVDSAQPIADSYRMKLYKQSQAKRDLPARKNSDSKTRGGKCLIIAGSPGMWGAALLSSRAAARTGAGYVYIFHEGRSPFVKDAPDFLSLEKLTKSELEKFDAIAIGPGLPTTTATLNKLKTLAKFKCQNVIVDASALSMLAKHEIKIPSTWILTPHEGELGRLIKKTGEQVRATREASIKEAQKKYGCVIILKGHGTLVANGQSVTKIDAGNPALAKAGTGDTLTGIITALVSQKLEPAKAAALGVYVHGTTADRWIKRGNDQLSFMASDIIEDLPKALLAIRSVRKTASRKRRATKRKG